MKKWLLLISLLYLFSPSNVALSQVTSKADRQKSEQVQGPLTLTQLEQLIKNPAISDKDSAAKDQAIATEILKRGITFQPTDFILENLRKLGPGPKTIQALEDLKKRSESIGAQGANSNKTIILVADFQGPEGAKSSVTDTIITELEDATREYSDVEIVPLNEPITAKQGRKWAGEKGKEHNASVVLWGWYDIQQGQVLVNVHFQVLQSSLEFLFFSEKQTLQIPLADLLSFQIRLSKEMAYLTFFTSGFVRFQAGDLAGAIDLFTSAIAQSNVPQRMVNPSDAYYFRSASHILQSFLVLGRVPDQAFEDLQQVINLKPEAAEGYKLRCTARSMGKEYELAMADCNKAIKLEPEGAEGYSGRANLYFQKGDRKSAIADIEKAIKLIQSDSDDIRIFFYRGLLSTFKDDADGLISNFSQIIKLDIPPFLLYPILIGRGAAYLEKKSYDLAMADFKRAIELSPQGPFAYWLLGDVFYNKKDFNSAISSYRRAIELGLKEDEAYKDLGDAYQAIGDINQAIESFSKAIDIDPEYREALISRAFLYTLNNEFDKAIKDYGKVIELNPEIGYTYVSRGYAFYRKGDLEKAFYDYGKAIELKPDNAQAYFFRGLAFESKGDLDLAIDDYGLAIKYNLKYAMAHFYRGELYSRKGNYDQAVNEYTQAINIAPDYVLAYLSRAETYMLKADHKSAISDLTKVLQLTSDPQIRKQAEQMLDSIGVK